MAEVASLANNVDAVDGRMIDVADGGDVVVEDRRLVEHVGSPLRNAAIPADPPSSASSEPMECESVAGAELTREIEEVIESPVREDMATRDSAANTLEGTGRDDTRNVDRPASFYYFVMKLY